MGQEHLTVRTVPRALARKPSATVLAPISTRIPTIVVNAGDAVMFLVLQAVWPGFARVEVEGEVVSPAAARGATIQRYEHTTRARTTYLTVVYCAALCPLQSANGGSLRTIPTTLVTVVGMLFLAVTLVLF